MGKISKLNFAIIIAIVAILSMVAGGLISRGIIFAAEAFDYITVFSQALSIIQRNYVDEIDVKSLIYGAVEGMMEKLDPYSQFMDAETYKSFETDLKGEFGGLGIYIDIRDNVLTVISPIKGTPAHRIGVKPLDKIIKIDGKSTENIKTTDEAVKILRGEPGTKVTITVLRDDKDIIDFTITRDIIRVPSVDPVFMADDEYKIGYVSLTQFRERVDEELNTELTRLEKDGMRGLILDLRDNGGGLLDSAVDIAKEFIGGGNVIVSTKERGGSKERKYYANRNPGHPPYPMVVLINRGTASASEIVTGAIKDLGRGIIVGERSFGKGSVQVPFRLDDGSVIKLTVAKYYTPSGKSIHGAGIEPDVEVKAPSLSDVETEMLQKLHKGTYIDQFLKNHPQFTEEDVKAFVSYLHDQGIILNEESIRREIAFATRDNNKDDIEYDVQFRKALDILREKLK
ncbi:MAG: S41 family peptidase [bacterium]